MEVTVHMRLVSFVAAVFLAMLVIYPAPASAAITSFSVTGQYLNMGLIPGTTVYNSTAANGINATVVSSGPWKITAYDALDAGSGGAPNKPAGTEGKMSEYVTATDVYVAAGKHLTNALQVSGDGGSTYKNVNAVGTAQTIAMGNENLPDGTSVKPIFKQVLAANEEAVKAANQYHIIVTFEASQN